MSSVFRFFVYSNLFIAVCAILMVNQTYDLVLHSPPDKYLMAFIFSATICSYSFHWYLTSGSLVESPRIEWLKNTELSTWYCFFLVFQVPFSSVSCCSLIGIGFVYPPSLHFCIRHPRFLIPGSETCAKWQLAKRSF